MSANDNENFSRKFIGKESMLCFISSAVSNIRHFGTEGPPTQKTYTSKQYSLVVYDLFVTKGLKWKGD